MATITHVIFKTSDGFGMTQKGNYDAYAMNANKVSHFRTANGFNTFMDVFEYARDIMRIAPEGIMFDVLNA